MFFESFDPKSRVWVYTADRALTATEENYSRDVLTQFIGEWAAHGNQLFGGFEIYKHRFIILSLDESQMGASGCSIDTSVRFFKELGKELGVDFFNRLNLVIEEDGALNTVHVSEVKQHVNAKVYNPMVATLHDLNTNWLIPVTESPFL